MDFGIASVAAITVICYLIGLVVKVSGLDNKWIPLIMGALGIVLNIWVSGWVFTPQILLGGLASGLAATGAFELIKNMAGRQK